MPSPVAIERRPDHSLKGMSGLHQESAVVPPHPDRMPAPAQPCTRSTTPSSHSGCGVPPPCAEPISQAAEFLRRVVVAGVMETSSSPQMQCKVEEATEVLQAPAEGYVNPVSGTSDDSKLNCQEAAERFPAAAEECADAASHTCNDGGFQAEHPAPCNESLAVNECAELPVTCDEGLHVNAYPACQSTEAVYVDTQCDVLSDDGTGLSTYEEHQHGQVLRQDASGHFDDVQPPHIAELMSNHVSSLSHFDDAQGAVLQCSSEDSKQVFSSQTPEQNDEGLRLYASEHYDDEVLSPHNSQVLSPSRLGANDQAQWPHALEQQHEHTVDDNRWGQLSKQVPSGPYDGAVCLSWMLGTGKHPMVTDEEVSYIYDCLKRINVSVATLGLEQLAVAEGLCLASEVENMDPDDIVRQTLEQMLQSKSRNGNEDIFVTAGGAFSSGYKKKVALHVFIASAPLSHSDMEAAAGRAPTMSVLWDWNVKLQCITHEGED